MKFDIQFSVNHYNKSVIFTMAQNIYWFNTQMFFLSCQEILKHHLKTLLAVAVRRRHINILHTGFHFYDMFVKNHCM